MEGRAIALTERLALLIQLDAQGAVKGLESVGKAADRNLGRVESKLDKAGQKFQKVGVGMLAAAGLAATGLYKAAEAASDLGETVSQSEQIFGDAADGIGSFAKGAAGSLGQSERAAREAANTFGLFFTNAGKSKDEAAAMSVELTKLASDMASFKNTSPEEAVTALGAALRGESEPIRTYGVMLDDATLKQRALSMGLIETTTGTLPPAIKQQAAYAEILAQTSTIQGDFTRTSEGMANQQRIASAEIENAMASLGQVAAPIIAEVAGGLADLAGGFTSADDATGGLLSKLATFGTLGLGAAGGISFVVGKVIELRDHIKGLPDKLSSLGKSMGGLGGGAFALAATGAGIFGLAMFKAQQRSEELRQAARELSEEAERTGKSLEDVALEKLAREFAESDQVTGAMERLGVSFAELREPLQGSADDFDAWAAAIRDGAPAGAVGAEAANHLIGRVEALRDQLGEAEQVTGRTTEANKALGIAEEETATQTAGLTEKVTEQKDALQELLDATLAQFDANLGYRQSVDDVEDSMAELLATQKEHGTNSEEYRDKLLDAEGALLDQAAALVRVYEDTAKANGQTVTAQEKTALYRGELERLRDGLAQNSPLRASLQGYIDQLNRIPKNVSTVLTLSTVDARNRLAAGKDAAMNANGTSFFEGGLSVVGERGPELVNLPRGSQVYDANRTAQMLGGGGVTNIYITTAADPQSVVEAIKRHTRSNGPLPASLVG